jgi:hypothetical protein
VFKDELSCERMMFVVGLWDGWRDVDKTAFDG